MSPVDDLSARRSGLSPAKRILLEKLSQGKNIGIAETPVISRRSPSSSSRLSFAQQRLWFLDLLTPESSAYNILMAVRLEGRLDIAALEQAIKVILQRHEILRTTFISVDGQPAQIIAPACALQIEQSDLSGLAVEQREAEMRRRMTDLARQPFDLAHLPLLRMSLLRLDTEAYALILVIHHIVFDGWSMNIFTRELATLYSALVMGSALTLPELPIQYADFAHWQREWLQGAALDAQLRYWRQQLHGAPAVLDLTPGRLRPPVQTFGGGRQPFVLPSSLADALRILSRQENATLFMTFLAAFKVVLRYYARRDDIIVATDVANRNRIEVEQLIGFFVNQLVLRTDLSGTPAFRDLLCRVREVCLAAYAHQDISFQQLVDALQLVRNPGYNPLFQVSFILNTLPEPIDIPSLTLTPLEIENDTVHFDLICIMTERPESISGVLQYRTDLFPPAMITQMIAHFEAILQQVVIHPEVRLDALDAQLAEAEQQQRRLMKQDFKATSLQKLRDLQQRSGRRGSLRSEDS